MYIYQIKSPLKAREWRERSEGLTMTAKGNKERIANANFMVGISYNKGVVLYESYTGSISGDEIARMVKKSFLGEHLENQFPLRRKESL